MGLFLLVVIILVCLLCSHVLTAIEYLPPDKGLIAAISAVAGENALPAGGLERLQLGGVQIEALMR